MKNHKIQLKDGFITVSAKILIHLNKKFTDLTKVTMYEALIHITELTKSIL